MCECDCVPPYVALSAADLCPGSQYVAFMSLVDIAIRYACSVADPCNRIIAKTRPRDSYDFIVIGSGSAGSTIAGRLAELSNYTTLVIEAGMDEPPASQVPVFSAFYNSPIDWNFTTEAETNACLSSEGICTWPRGKVLGGTSNFNGMMYMRGTPADYQRWVDAGNDEWSYEDILPVFKASEGNMEVGTLVSKYYHGTEGPFTIKRFNFHPALADDILVAAKQQGFPVVDDLNADKFVGFTIAQANNRNGARLSLAKAFIRPHKNNPNFDVMLNSTVTKITVEGEELKKRATGVQLVYNDVLYTVKATKEVILAAGAVNTPQILLLSGIGSQDKIEPFGIKQVHNLTGVGEGIRNHVSFPVNGTLNRLNEVDLNNDTLNDYITKQGGPLSGTGMSTLTGRLASSNTTSEDPDIQFFFSVFENTCAYAGASHLLVDPSNPTALRTLAINTVNLRPKSKGYIGLRSSDPFDKPVIVANYLTAPDDIMVLLEGIRIIQNFTSAPIMVNKYNYTIPATAAGNCSTLYEYDSDDFWLCAIKYATYPENHQTGSCKMLPVGHPEACVNQRLQVHGIPNLRIVDASVIPESPSGNIQAVIVAVAERASWFIKEDHLDSTMS